ncbi:hypothetical protein DDV21_001135 [Streptococcus chenjunshii]|uniref:Uncharacterized protein n=1 Tax=Streptococcus chenjunshii TaxID=2173853 RepID=A0A372KLC0_9STRE|nr:hypothetical protein [Streptococcus chenjunshii]AXQ77774.1 hypothetical protein DDV21_001135 [Streptococcus chenjunshii]RFU50496.1 hypothetical protein DDV22_08470 [Streptococcus chenjunshii]RFU52724.1 hypothetical protein DDV23_08310 [Streptococcus chenjunshii]
MIATVRVRDETGSIALCELDLMRFSEGQVRERMRERGFRDDSFFVCGFSDWGVDRVMSLKEAYALKKCVLELYDSDDFIVRYLLKKQASIKQILSAYYTFLTKNEQELVKYFLKGKGSDYAVSLFYNCGNWVGLVQAYIETGLVLNTTKGFYIKSL